MTTTVWDGSIPAPQPGPAVWLLGATGGAGVSTLAAFFEFAEDCQHQWPSGADPHSESPFVVVVARETIASLKAAHALLMQHQSENLACRPLGVITVSASREDTKPVRQYREVVRAAAPAHWAIGHHPGLISAGPDSLPSWRAKDGIPPGSHQFPGDVLAAGAGIITAIQQQLPQMGVPL
ncbi:hypothetical protein [Hoyosella subflava]|uniref:Uncharacterized protein n=1 Tax=Hoyosella subflava (strain DSM 45089 / JCM 17490 / NBRC 109087 / DQS3-9A1) TaxID=443218 RepID=F6ESH9_HOYSD|nr:hypothetical protein [Hoyosella subflava]AEF43100.1 hypothetical protein AS9A_P20056 [Hoyosella subflava DQS3-9A1]